jgi:hypothetical protein
MKFRKCLVFLFLLCNLLWQSSCSGKADNMATADSAGEAIKERSRQLKITVGKPFTIASITWEEIRKYADPKYLETNGYWGFWSNPNLRKCADDSLLLGFGTAGDLAITHPIHESLLRSYDNGATWKMDPMAKLRHVSPCVRKSFIHFNGVDPLYGMGPLGFCNLSDGSSIIYDWSKKDVNGGPSDYLASMWRSSDGGATWSEPMDVNVSGGGHMWYRSVELSNGNLVTTAHGGGRTFAMGSSDKGYSWSPLGTIAAGASEPIVCKLANDELISIMRTGHFKPMYQSRSTDGGVTWSTPIQPGINGVAPDMHLLSNGVLACSYGRTGDPPNGNHIMFSIDGTGNNWTNHTLVFGGSSTSYTSFEEISPGRLLYVFGVIGMDLPSGNPRNAIRGVYIDVDIVE